MSNLETIDSMRHDLRMATETMRGVAAVLVERGEALSALNTKSRDILTDTVALNRRIAASNRRLSRSRLCVCVTISFLLYTIARLTLFE